MDSQADFDGGICCVARADPMFFVPEERMTCEYVDLAEVEFDYIENEEMIGHIIQVNADVPKVRVRLATLHPVPTIKNNRFTDDLVKSNVNRFVKTFSPLKKTKISYSQTQYMLHTL